MRDALLIIEAVNEDIETKRLVLQKLDKYLSTRNYICLHKSSFVYNTTGIFYQKRTTSDRSAFFQSCSFNATCGSHSWTKYGARGYRLAFQFVKKLDKLPIKVDECASFLVNRLLGRYMNEAAWILQDGLADVETIDKAACNLLMPIGPLQLRDMNGLDIGLSVARFKLRRIW